MQVHINGVIYNMDAFNKCSIVEENKIKRIAFYDDTQEVESVHFKTNSECDYEFQKIVSVIGSWYS